MNYYNEIKNKIIDNEIYSKIKDYSKERNTVITYYEIGRLLNEAGGKYGDNIINEYSKKLVIDVGKKYNRRTLFRMRQFYNVFSNEKVSTMSTQLTWSHYTELLPIKDINKLFYYLNISIKQNIDVRGLRNKIKIGNRYNYIDLLLFNIQYNCYVVVELKVTELKKEHIGQIQFYMNYIDNNLKTINQEKTIDIIICKKENKYVIEYCIDKRIVARHYELV